MKIFLDANVLVSVLNKEYPLFTFSSRVLSLADNPAFQLYTSPVCLAIAFYFAEKKTGRTSANKKIGLLMEKLDVAEHTKTDIHAILQNKKIHDFEDGLEYYAALRAGCHRIVTENKKDFYFSEVKVTACAELLKEL